MIIQLTNDIPVDPKHGMTKGKVFEVIRKSPRTEEADEGIWVLSDIGTEVKIFEREYNKLK